MSSSHPPRILIVGAGPVGLTLGVELARRGIKPDIIDCRTKGENDNQSRAIGVHSRTLDILEASGVTEKLLKAGNKVTMVRWVEAHRMSEEVKHECGEELLRADVSSALQKERHNFVLVVPQPVTERLLREALTEYGCEVEWEVELMTLHEMDGNDQQEGGQPQPPQTKSEVKVQCKYGASGKSCDKVYDIVVGCDGSHSVVRKSAGIAFNGRDDSEHMWHLADIKLPSAATTANESNTGEGTSNDSSTDQPASSPSCECHKLNQLTIKFTGPEEVMACFPVSAEALRCVYRGPKERFDQLLKNEIPSEVPLTPIWESDFKIRYRIADTYHKGAVFLAGDAAHVHSPVGARGMNLGIEDSATLAYLISRNESHRYGALRRPVGLAVVEATDFATTMLTSDKVVYKMWRYFIPKLLRFEWFQGRALRRFTGANTPRPEWLTS